MHSSRTRWIGGMGAVVLVGALLVTSVVAADDDKGKHSSGSGDGHHTLRWDTNHASATRFTTAFHGAVLDKNTGLVWEQSPEVTPLFWFLATIHCVGRTVGGMVGWRLPSVPPALRRRTASATPSTVCRVTAAQQRQRTRWERPRAREQNQLPLTRLQGVPCTWVSTNPSRAMPSNPSTAGS